MRTKRSVKQIIQEEPLYSKPITASETFWGATLMVLLTLGFVGYDGTTKGFTAIHGAVIPSILAGYFSVLQGRIKANDGLPVYTPDWLPGPNRADTIPEDQLDYLGEPSSYIPDRD